MQHTMLSLRTIFHPHLLRDKIILLKAEPMTAQQKGAACMRIHFLKTQWSDMIILEKDGHFALVDTGFDEQYDQLSKYLNNLGAKRIDFILLTHFHRDHYGNIINLIDNYDVGKVYFKEYGGHDYNTAWGSVADDEYRQSECDKWENMREAIIKNSSLQMVEEIQSIDFEGTVFYLYSNGNSVQTIWDDESHPDTFHKNAFSENQNSLAVFFEVEGKTVFLGGDIMDYASSHPLANFVNLQIAKKINKEIYLYKVPHHGTCHTTCEEALKIYRPKISVITNGMEWLDKYDTIAEIKAVSPDGEILLTEHNDVVIELQKEK